jgi:hypothetical protein
VSLPVGDECGGDLELGKRLPETVYGLQTVYGLPGKCLDCNATVLPRWWLGPRLFTTGEQHGMVCKYVGPRCHSSVPV